MMLHRGVRQHITLIVVFLLVVMTVLNERSGAEAAPWPSNSRQLHGGCLGAGLCCQGKNSTCRVEGPRANDPRSRSCFCDSACFTTNDCCADMQQACNIRPVDCVLSGWTDWSDCDARCGTGIKQRRRSVIVHPENGGRSCGGPLIEKTVCEGTGCKQPRAHNVRNDVVKETGHIIPASFGSWRRSKRYDPYKDIRKNLFEHYEGHMLADQPPPYCAKFRVTQSRPSCSRTPLSDWPKLLTSGAELCVECQPLVMSGGVGAASSRVGSGRCAGHGVRGRETRWTAVAVPGCHGTWIMTTHHQNCRCPADDEYSFVLV